MKLKVLYAWQWYIMGHGPRSAIWTIASIWCTIKHKRHLNNSKYFPVIIPRSMFVVKCYKISFDVIWSTSIIYSTAVKQVAWWMENQEN